MRRLSHPITGWTYEWADLGAEGRFDRDGRWVRGALFVADPEMCRWIASGGSDAGGAAGQSRRFAIPPESRAPEVSP
jgi:hypothetical protein